MIKKIYLTYLINQYKKKRGFSGSVAILKNGKGLFEMDTHGGEARKKYALCSISKLYTSALIHRLVELGLWDLETSISQCVSHFSYPKSMTIKTLLANEGGISDFVLEPQYHQSEGEALSPLQLLSMVAEKPLAFEPGEGFNYSNSHYILLQMALEGVTGLSFEQALRKYLLDPLQLKETGISDRPEIGSLGACGGLEATAADCARFLSALCNFKIIDRAGFLSMTTSHNTSQYGLGIELGQTFSQNQYGHSGGIKGYVGLAGHLETCNLTVVILSDSEGAPLQEMFTQLAAICLGQPVEKVTAHHFVGVGRADLEAYMGDYNLSFFGRETVLTISYEGESFYMSTPGLNRAKIMGTSDGGFYAKCKGDVYMRFENETIHLNWSGHALKAFLI